MNTLKEIYENPGKFDLSFEAIKRLRQIHIAFETNPFFLYQDMNMLERT